MYDNKIYNYKDYEAGARIRAIKDGMRNFLYGGNSNTLGKPVQTDPDFFSIVASLKRPIQLEGKDRSIQLAKIKFRYTYTYACLFDTIQILTRDPLDSSKYVEISSKNIVESLGVEEKSIVDYLKGFLKGVNNFLTVKESKRNGYHVDFENVPIRTLLEYIGEYSAVLAMPADSSPANQPIAPIMSQFPQLCSAGRGSSRKIYLYSDEAFESTSHWSQLPLVLKDDLRKSLKVLSYLKENDLAVYEKSFKSCCEDLIRKNTDPMSIFSNFNPIFKNERNLNEVKLSLEEINLISYFMMNAGCEYNPDKLHNRDNPNIFRSGLKPVNAAHNYNIFEKIISLEHFSSEHIRKNLFIAFVNKDSKGRIISSATSKPISVHEAVGKSIQVTHRQNRFPTPPVIQFDAKDPEKINISSIDSIESAGGTAASQVFFSIRAYGEEYSAEYGDEEKAAQSSNAVYQCKELGRPTIENSTADVYSMLNELEFDVAYPFTKTQIQRIFIRNNNTGENITFSKVFSHDSSLYQKIIGEKYSNIEEKLRGINAIGFSINNNDSEEHHPQNLIKIYDIPRQLRISKVTFFSGIPVSLSTQDNQNQQLAYVEGSNTIVHNDPIPGEKYTYVINFAEKDTGIITKNAKIEVKVKTARMSNLNLNLVRGVTLLEKESEELGSYNYYKVSIAGQNLRDYRANFVNRTIDKIFPPPLEGDGGEARETFADKVKEKLNEDLSVIGSSFRLAVLKYNKNSGDLINENILESLSDDDQNRYFEIKIPRNGRPMVIGYNLIIDNPFENINLDEIVEGDDVNKTKFLRKTSKYFNDITINTGILPGPNREDNDKNARFNNVFGSDFDFANSTCIGGVFEHYGNNIPSSFGFSAELSASPLYNGEFSLRWQAEKPQDFLSNSIDFFVVTCVIMKNEIEHLEFPIDAHPYITNENFEPFACNIRTRSFEGIASYVKFRVYIVNNNFNISNIFSESQTVNVSSRLHVRSDQGRVIL